MSGHGVWQCAQCPDAACIRTLFAAASRPKEEPWSKEGRNIEGSSRTEKLGGGDSNCMNAVMMSLRD